MINKNPPFALKTLFQLLGGLLIKSLHYISHLDHLSNVLKSESTVDEPSPDPPSHLLNLKGSPHWLLLARHGMKRLQQLPCSWAIQCTLFIDGSWMILGYIHQQQWMRIGPEDGSQAFPSLHSDVLGRLVYWDRLEIGSPKVC